MTNPNRVTLRHVLEKVNPAGTVPGSPEDFLIRLAKIDAESLTVRDVLCLYVVQAKPGISGLDLAYMVGQAHRSGVDSNIRRLIDRKMIEDRRLETRKAVPNALFALPAGVEFWNTLKG